MLIAELDLAAVERHRVEWPFLRDRRVDAYAGLTAPFLDGTDELPTTSDAGDLPGGGDGIRSPQSCVDDM